MEGQIEAFARIAGETDCDPEELSKEGQRMAFCIEIIEEHDPSSYFWFRPVILHSTDQIKWGDVEELDDEFSIEEGDVSCFVRHFLYKYFDKDLPCNKNRYEDGGYSFTGFEWYLTHNFFTYETISSMLEDIARVADLLESDYDAPALDEVKEHYSIFYLCEQDCEDWIRGNQLAIPKYKHLIIDFYRRFISRTRQMMENFPQAEYISVMGP